MRYCQDRECHVDREAKMVSFETGGKTVFCDPCIAEIVRALNAAGVETIASCCGHGLRPGNIALADGREIIIARNYDEGRVIDRVFPITINGKG